MNMTEGNAGSGPLWVLKGEGKANLVFAYQGPDEELAGYVLRVRKAAAAGHDEHHKKHKKAKHHHAAAAAEQHARGGHAVVLPGSAQESVTLTSTVEFSDPATGKSEKVVQSLAAQASAVQPAAGGAITAVAGAAGATLAGGTGGTSSGTQVTAVAVTSSTAEEEDAEADKAAHDILEERIWAGTLHANDKWGREMEYVASYITGLVGSDYVHAGKAMELPAEVVATMAAQGAAPASGLPALLMPDHSSFAHGAPAGFKALGPVVCVEIKPKAGCLPISPHLSAEAAPLKQRFTRFTMHALLKHTEGKGVLSAYDPRDLFSREPARVGKALHALLEAPNNNIRVFAANQLVYGGRPTEEEGDTDVYRSSPAVGTPQELAVQLGKMYGPGTSQPLALVTGAVQQVLSSEELLSKLLAVQSMDEVDVEGALPLYTALLTRYRQQYKAQQAGASNAASSTGSGEKVWERYDEAGALAGLRGYLTAATAKDCGVMVTLQLLEAEPGSDPEAAAAAALAAHKGKAWPKLVQLEAGEGPGPSSRPVWALYKVATLDLDLKRASKIPTHAALDAAVVACAAAKQGLLEELLAGKGSSA